MKILNDSFPGMSKGRRILAAAFMTLFLVSGATAMGGERQVLPGHVLPVTGKLHSLGRLPGTNTMSLAIGLPLSQKNQLSAFLEQLYDPASANFHHYLTPQEFADRFCATEADYQALIGFAKANHLTVTALHPNRMLLDVTGNVADIENAFNIKMQVYQHPTENRTFFAPDVDPSVPVGLQVSDISGLNNYRLPHPKYKLATTTSPKTASPKIGSGPSGNYIGNDFRAAYVPNVPLTGAGQTIGLLQFDGYFQDDILAYELLTGRTNVPLVNVLLDGFNGVPTGNGGEVEVSLDIEMSISMAPGLSEIILYEAGPFGTPNDILNRMATDNLARQLSCSWGWTGGPQTTTEQIFLQMAAQGQTFFDAAGDGDAFLPGQVDDPSFPGSPSSSPNITQVGGTTLTTSGPAGLWVSETVWNWGIEYGQDGVGTSGGISSFYALPTYQQGISMTANMGSTNNRNIPDVALTGDNVLVIADNGIYYTGTGGTSCAAPLWAGFTSLVNQQAAEAGQPPVGFLNPAIYAIGKGANYTNCFHDITTGNDTWSQSPNEFFAVPGYDLCSGWGTPAGASLINALAPPPPSANLFVLTNIISGGNGNGIIDFNECNDLNLVLTNGGTLGATGVNVSLLSVTPGVVVAQTVSGYNNIPSGGTATNQVPFQISTSPNFICGTPIVLSAVIQSDQITSVLPLVLPTGVQLPAVQFGNATPVSISGTNPGTAVSTINVNNLDGALENLTVSVNVTCPQDSQLILRLVSPDGTNITLSSDNGGAFGQNYGFDCSLETTFDDGAPTLIDAGTAPFLGTFRPDQPLSTFAGKTGSTLNGNWQLYALDSASNPSGSIQCWSMNLVTAVCTNGGGQCPGVDLAVGISAQPNPVTVQNQLTYTMQVTNNGPNTATGVGLVQALPAGAAFVSGNSSQGTVSYSGGVVSCALGDMLATATATVTVIATPSVTGIASSTATVSSSETDVNPANNSATASVLVNPMLADLALGLTANANSVALGSILTYTVSVTNRGPSAAQNVTVTNTLPSNVSITSVDSSQGSPASAPGSVITALGTLAKNAVATVTIQVRPVVVNPITMTAAVGSTVTDPIPGNNSATLITPVVPSADLSLTMTGSPASAIVGSNITYTLTVQNLGPSSAANVSVNDTLPANITLLSATNSLGGWSQTGGVLTFTVTNLPASSNAIMSIVISTAPLISQVPVTISNTATVSSFDDDPNLANNTASVSTRVDYARAVVVPAGSILASESYSPTNGFIDPGETVAVDFRLQNIGNLDTTNLVATLLGTGGVVLTNGPQVQSYGRLPAGGAGETQQFYFAANTTNGGTINATLQLQDGATSLGTAVFSYTLPTVSTFAKTNNIVVSDNGEASLYPSTINVSGVTGLIAKVTVTLTNMNHTYPDGLDLLLVGPASQSTLLMSHCGGSGSISNVSLTFDDSASNYLPETPQIPVGVQIVSGTFKPTPYEDGMVVFPSTNTSTPPPSAPYGTNLSGSFDGTNANGQWSLYVYDNEGADSGIIIGGWSLAIAAGTPVNDIVDLGVTGSSAPNNILAGNQFTYTFTITNNGPNAANLVAFTNVLPQNISLITASSTQGICSNNGGGTVYCTVSNLASGAIVTVTETVLPTLPGVITNTATVTCADSDLNQANNTANVITTVTAPTADVALSMSASPLPAVVSHGLVYVLTVTNNGPGAAFDVVVTEPLNGVDFFSETASTSTTGSNISGTATCNVGTLAPGGSAVVLLTVVPYQTGTYTNVATASTASSDPTLTNNSATLVITVGNPAPSIVPAGAWLLPTGLTYANGAINPGETVTVSFVLTNNGTAGTSNLVATLLSSNGVTPLSGSQTYGALVPGGAVGSNNFTFSATGTNGGVVSAVLQLQDGANNLGTAVFNFNLPATNSFASGTGGTFRYGSPQAYPISISGLTGVVSKVTVTLSNLTHSFPSDLEMLLVGPGGQDAILMATAGGAYAITNVNVTFDDAASATLPRNGQIVSGTNKLSDFALVAPFTSPAPAGPYGLALAAFDGTLPNGVWTLYVLDDSPADSGSFGGWGANITTVNPVNAAADVGVTLANPPGLLLVGENFNYTVNVTNGGPATATDVTVTQTLAGLNFVSTSQSGYSNQAGVLTFYLGSMAAGSNVTFTITVNSTLSGVYSPAAGVSADQTDLNPANNNSSAPTTVTVPTPALLTGNGFSNGLFKFTITGLPGQYVLQASPDLTNWAAISTNTVPNLGTLQLTDPFAGSFQRRYYRVVFIVP